MSDPYETLGVPRDAGAIEINAAYRAKAKTAHPDGGGSPDKFRELQEAHAVLLDPSLRRLYDETGRIDQKPVENEERVVAINYLGELLSKVLSATADKDPTRFDIIAAMRRVALGELGEMRKVESQILAQLQRAEIIMARIKGDDPALKMVLRDRVESQRPKLLKVQRMIGAAQSVEKMLETYRYEADLDTDDWAHAFQFTNRMQASASS